ncbi:hypothetical protein RFI_07216 [Reticulomyxa filosa]|uniref:Uncharacterized protein n=1 Tax=Reticulomyxa filosa TaxID=46433 RepID=X6NV89_RETFI|nr:hypothetical protein RFI_07216 [Reticulomyxa filosa]|eukprot:ETO29906.1 hypothetical protein RFI_07216 [Reticulomyxa filosa]
MYYPEIVQGGRETKKKKIKTKNLNIKILAKKSNDNSNLAILTPVDESVEILQREHKSKTENEEKKDSILPVEVCAEMQKQLSLLCKNRNLKDGVDYLLVKGDDRVIELTSDFKYEFEHGVYLLGKNVTLTCGKNKEDDKGRLILHCSHLFIGQTCNINCNELGYKADQGPGCGKLVVGMSSSGSGAGHGKPGKGAGEWIGSGGGATYGDKTLEKLDFGSGGGSYTQRNGYIASGGAGGGILDITVTDQMLNLGEIQANGANGKKHSPNVGGGGGSGGSIRIKLTNNTFKHKLGKISCEGGKGGGKWSGDGGQGRIAIYGVTPTTIDPQSIAGALYVHK